MSAGRLRPDPEAPVSHDPRDREDQLAWARGVLASPAQAADDQLCARACQVLIELGRDHTDTMPARELLAILQRG